MDFGDKIDDLPTDEQTPPSNELQMLMNIFKPEEPSKFNDISYIAKLGGIAVILYIVLNQQPVLNIIQQYTKNPTTNKVVILLFIIMFLYIYHTYF